MHDRADRRRDLWQHAQRRLRLLLAREPDQAPGNWHRLDTQHRRLRAAGPRTPRPVPPLEFEDELENEAPADEEPDAMPESAS
jgi:hypothetical protein